jgi:Zn-dependent peptidase ImmA (M78 family)
MWNPYLHAEEHCIHVVEHDLPDPVVAFYIAEPDIPPTIILSSALRSDPRLRRCIMAHELGHHETSRGFNGVRHYTTYQDMLNVVRVEHRADRWAVRKLIPDTALWNLVMSNEDMTYYDICAHFDVTPKYACMRMQVFLADYYEKLYIRGDRNSITFGLLEQAEDNSVAWR